MRVHVSAIVILITGTCFAKDSTEITGYEGQSLSIDCPYSAGNENRGKYFCRLQGLPCEDLVRTSVHNSWVKRGRFALFDNTSARVFTLNISELNATDSGKYWCGADVSFLPDAIKEVQITVKHAENSTGAFTTQKTVNSSSPAITVHSGPTGRQQQSHFRFLTVITMTCVGMLFFVCMFSLAQVLKRINSCSLSGSTSYNIRGKSDPEHHEDDYVRMKPGVGRVVSPAAEDKSSPELDSSLQMHSTGAAVAGVSNPEIEPYYLETFTEMKTGPDADYIDPNLPTLYENLMSDSMEEPIYHTLDVTDG